MVLGLYALMAGVYPYKFHEWHMAMYIDAVDWISLPNTLGMSQFGDGGIVATKPYCATGNYIKRMSNACSQCPYDPAKSVGKTACPFTSLYWSFLSRHRAKLVRNSRMTFQMRNLANKSIGEIIAIRKTAEDHLATVR
jgi:deoxyribodipyrimidine photolyase-related protein